MRIALAVLAFLTSSIADPAGSWEGAVEIPGMPPLEFTVTLSQGDDGWVGTISIPAQGATNIPLSGITVEERAVRFAIAGVEGNPTFAGELSEDGDTIAGTFTQGGQGFPFTLERPDTGR